MWDTEWEGTRGSWRLYDSIWEAVTWVYTYAEIHPIYVRFVPFTEFIPQKQKLKTVYPDFMSHNGVTVAFPTSTHTDLLSQCSRRPPSPQGSIYLRTLYILADTETTLSSSRNGRGGVGKYCTWETFPLPSRRGAVQAQEVFLDK